MKTKNLSKVIVLGGAVVSMMTATSVFAAGNCDASGGQATSTALASGDENGLVESPLTLFCSANVYVGWNAVATGSEVAVRAGSKKGMHTFGASSRGGSPRVCEPTTSLATPHTTAATVTAGGDGCS